MSRSIPERVAELYDASVPDWPGEIDFYQELAAEATAKGERVLEVACGTGRVAIRLAKAGAKVTGIDLSPAMLDIARAKSADMPNIRWVHADMRDFDLGETFGLALIPGHSFQNLLTSDDQAATLQCIHRHLVPSAVFVMHLDPPDMRWLGDLLGEKRGVFEEGEMLIHPRTGRLIRASHAWTYEPSTQTATKVTLWEEFGPDDRVVDRWQEEPIPLHAVFRFEIEHLLARTGSEIEALYGDFFGSDFKDDSPSMVWVARNA
jgi:ubiquinone/menaquinone biosynthesis C-methylase UbiE